MSTITRRRTSCGMANGQLHRGQPAERHPDHDLRVAARGRRPSPRRRRRGWSVCTHRRGATRSARGPGRSTASAGRPSASTTVSHVWAFCAPPWTNTTSTGSIAPPQVRSRCRPGSDGNSTLTRSTGGITVDVEIELGDVLVEQPELVVVEHRCVIVDLRSSCVHRPIVRIGSTSERSGRQGAKMRRGGRRSSSTTSSTRSSRSS